MIDDSTICIYQKDMSQKNHVTGGRALEVAYIEGEPPG